LFFVATAQPHYKWHESIGDPTLADRAIFLTLEPIPEEKQQFEKELWEEFDKDRPYILGALLDAVSLGLRRLPEIRLEKLPRMADFAIWATACETMFWSSGTFIGNIGYIIGNSAGHTMTPARLGD